MNERKAHDKNWNFDDHVILLLPTTVRINDLQTELPGKQDSRIEDYRRKICAQKDFINVGTKEYIKNPFKERIIWCIYSNCKRLRKKSELQKLSLLLNIISALYGFIKFKMIDK